MTRAQGGGWQEEVLRELRGSAPTPAAPKTAATANDASEPGGFERGTTASQKEAEGAKAPLPVRHTDEPRPNPGQPSVPHTDSAATAGDIPRETPANPTGSAEQLPQPVSQPRPFTPHATPNSNALAQPAPARNPQGQAIPAAHPAVPSAAPPAASGSPITRHRPATPALPFPTPESVPTIDPRLALALGKPAHGDSMARRTGQTIRRLTSSASQEVAEETRIGRELQQPVTTGRVIAVTSIRGGVGKTTTAALLARTFNHYRHDPVLALEADAALGTLPVRLGADSVRWSCTELAHILTPQMHLTDITGYLVPVTDGGWLLPASQGRLGPPLDIRTYRTVTLALRRYFSVTVVDCETLPGEVARTAMDTAHARVVVAPLTAEGVGGTRVVLDWLAQLPHEALASTVVALTSGTPDQNLDLKTATAHLRETGVSIVHLPYDRHLAAGGPIRTQLLGSGTRRAATQLAAQALQRAVRVR
ncbi:type VII secretion protein [Streptomyces longisporus]|uniref:MinD-like ATPase involved in chromosome partitioning or flagellar assembly n=1 Tax=Streptomyces longisporus TaxID=1948 RepID=A0ABP6ARA3_STRLO